MEKKKKKKEQNPLSNTTLSYPSIISFEIWILMLISTASKQRLQTLSWDLPITSKNKESLVYVNTLQAISNDTWNTSTYHTNTMNKIIYIKSNVPKT